MAGKSLSPKSIHTRRVENIEKDREMIRRVGDPLRLLATIAAGYPVAEFEAVKKRDGTAKVKKLVQPTLDHRLRAADILARRLLPELKSVDMTDGAGQPLSINVEVPFALPGHEKVIEGTVVEDPRKNLDPALRNSLDRRFARVNQAVEDAIEVDEDHDDDEDDYGTGFGYV